MSVPQVAVENVLEKNWLEIVNFRSTEMESAQSLPVAGLSPTAFCDAFGDLRATREQLR
ncbi:MAG: hypothetical protein WCJ09_17255 [Planctomycetota bacterium]